MVKSFFYKPPNDIQIYNITCEETLVSFELVSQLLINNNKNDQLHEFHFLQFDEKRCYKVTCELISHSLIVMYLNRSIHGIENKHQHQEYVEFSKEFKENLEFHLKQFLVRYLTSK